MKKDILTLGIESSCDETSVAVVKNGREILSNIIDTQIPIHEKYGGVVPEIASRNHIEAISRVTKKALEEATKLVESAEKSLNNDDYEVALKAVNSLVDSDAKKALVERLDKVKFNIEVNKAALEKCSSSEPNQGTCSNANCTKWIVLSVILFVGLLTESAYLVFRKK